MEMPASSLFELPLESLNMSQFSKGKKYFFSQLRIDFQRLKQLISGQTGPLVLC